MKKKIIFIVIIIIIIYLLSLILNSTHSSLVNNNQDIYKTICGEYKKGQINISNKILSVNIADDECKMTLGLSGNEDLNNDGMLFIFEKEGNYGFWMKDMNFSLDILWIDDNFQIIGIEKNLLPSTYPKSYGAKYLARYVLELSSGYCEKNNIKVGDKIIFSKN